MEMVQQSVYWIILGLIKKVLFADNLGIVVHSAFEHPELLSSLDLWLAVYAFAFQIYFDFSGYTDIARGSPSCLALKYQLILICLIGPVQFLNSGKDGICRFLLG